MNGYNFVLWITGLVLAVLAALVFFAARGSIVAAVALGSLATLVIGALFFGLFLLIQAIGARREEKRFRENTKEDLAIMSQMQRVQNQQNTMLQSELGKVARLPDRSGPEPTVSFDDLLAIEEGVFSELDD